MEFEVTQIRTPTSIGDIRVLLEVKADGSETAEYTVQILDGSGNTIKHAQGDLVPYLTTTQINALKTLMTNVRTKAQKLIPGA